MLVSDVSASAKYALGCAYLHHDELHKAKSSFLEAIVAIDANQDSEFETLKRYLEINGNVVPHLTKVEYYKVIMRAFEDLIPPRLDALEESDQPQKYRQLVAPFLVVDFANMAITALESQLAPYGAERDEDHDVQLSVLQSNVVKHTLQLGLQDRAFTAIMNVPNKTHQKNVLQSMTQVLCKRREYQTLVEFPFGDLEPAVVDILEKMADNINVRDAVGDVEGKVPNCYEVLYCFYVHRGNYKKAAREMYTLSQKFKVAGDEFLEHELKAYCNAICSLQLVSPQSQWLDVLVEGHLITKELDEIEGEYLLAQAYKDLSEMGTTPRVLNDRVEAATRTIISLVKEGMFDRAMTVSCSFQGVTDCLKHIFTGLASECVKLSRKQSPGEGGWVGALNDLNPRCTNVAGPASAQGQDDPLQPSHTIFINEMRCAAADRAWHLLRLFLAKHDATADNNFMYHECVVDTILHSGVPLPTWLVASCKRRHPAALLKAYVSYAQLDNAFDLAIAHIMAVDGLKPHRVDFFGSETASRPDENEMDTWLPYSVFDQLIERGKGHHKHEVLIDNLNKFRTKGSVA